ncbi:MAG: hypothetical protein ACI4TP_01540 [Anaerotignum sp.]
MNFTDEKIPVEKLEKISNQYKINIPDHVVSWGELYVWRLLKLTENDPVIIHILRELEAYERETEKIL